MPYYSCGFLKELYQKGEEYPGIIKEVMVVLSRLMFRGIDDVEIYFLNS